jgi:hypothetical protein
MESKVLHFTVEPEGVVELAREQYWFEDKKQYGVDILRCFIGIESYQITRVLEGDATFKKNENGKIYYEEVSDERFKKALADFLAYRKKQDETEFTYIGGVRVRRDIVEEYAGHIVKRLRDTMRNTAHGIMLDIDDMDEILGLETRRQELHDYILQSVGFDRDDDSKEACLFRTALSHYVDDMAGSLFKEPVESMLDDEVKEKRKKSEAFIKYMDDKAASAARTRQLYEAGLL